MGLDSLTRDELDALYSLTESTESWKALLKFMFTVRQVTDNKLCTADPEPNNLMFLRGACSGVREVERTLHDLRGALQRKAKGGAVK